ncbi:MAG TPA: hypothetical protein VMS17_04265 [Gemmataceae bacterium]|nr:hypothetical protein [Gemmataceae bacterium]
MRLDLAIVKVGGSLYDIPDLGSRLNAWLTHLPAPKVLFVPGGGPTAEVVRHFDRIHQLGDEQAHWLALGALSLNARFLNRLLLSAPVIDHPDEARDTCILDPFAFLRRDDRLPHSWSVTSDAIAAHAALVAGAQHLILLKSVSIPEDMDWDEAGERGYVDPWFARTVRPALPRLQVRAVNFRDWTP